MSKLGWSYPPGVSKLPWDDIQLICQVCLGDPEAAPHSNSPCLCPECDICGSAGDPACYARGHHTNHGLELNREHRHLVEERQRRLTELHEQERMADLHLAKLGLQQFPLCFRHSGPRPAKMDRRGKGRFQAPRNLLEYKRNLHNKCEIKTIYRAKRLPCRGTPG